MSRLVWDKIGERRYETGVDRGVLFPQVGGAYPKGHAWNGLIGVTEKPTGAEATPIYADNIKYLNLMSAEDFGAGVEAYTYPPEFEPCNGGAKVANGLTVGQQKRQQFGMSYRTLIGNDTDGTDYGYMLHLVYGAQAAPAEKNYQTVNESPEAMTMSWELTTTPVVLTAVDPATNKPYKPTAHLMIDSTTADPVKLKALEDLLYGTDGDGENATESKLPMPDEVIAMFAAASQVAG